MTFMKLKKRIILYIALACIFFSILYFTLFHFLLASPIEAQKTKAMEKTEDRGHAFEIIERAAGRFLVLLIFALFLSGIIFYIIINRMVIGRVMLKDNKIKREQVERSLALNEKLVFSEKVSASIAHEINNPLFAISNSFQLAKRYLPTDNKRVNDAVQLFEKEIKRVKKLSRNMHAFVIRDIEEATPSDITAIVKDAVNTLEWSEKLADTGIDFRKNDASFPLTCNPGSLQQVFMNIIINAVEAMDGKGKVIIDISEENRHYRIDIIDNGPGVPDSVKADIFQPFRSTKSGKGIGLGLHISHNIITNHGGTISLDENDQQGAHFIIKIPNENKGGLSNDKEPVNTIS